MNIVDKILNDMDKDIEKMTLEEFRNKYEIAVQSLENTLFRISNQMDEVKKERTDISIRFFNLKEYKINTEKGINLIQVKMYKLLNDKVSG